MTKHRNVLTTTAWSAPSYWQPKAQTLLVLCLGLLLFGVGEGLMILAALGSSPWMVLAQGFMIQTGISIGMSTLLISLAVMFLWIPLRQKLGLGTVLNILLIALGVELTNQLLPAPDTWPARLMFSLGGIFIIGIASAFYLTCHMGAGPRDGLMVGISQRTGWKVGVVRTILEICVCSIGWLLGGVVGLSTLLFALGVGWVLQATLMLLSRYRQST